MNVRRRTRLVLLAALVAAVCLAGQVAAVAADLPGAFGKTSPANGATHYERDTYLMWGAGTAVGATDFFYCINTSPSCGAGGWQGGGLITQATFTNLLPGTTYYWQVKATNANGTTFADGGAWWSFTTSTFGKAGPANGATGVVLNPTLSWGTEPGASAYSYCLDTTDDDYCVYWGDSTTATSAALTGLSPNTTYYWQVEALIPGVAYAWADRHRWDFWSFTTGALPPVPNDDFGAATVIGGAPFTTTQDVAAASKAPDDPGFSCSSDNPRSRSVWYRYTPTGAQIVTVDTIGSDYDTVLGVWTGSRGSLTSVGCNDDAAGGIQSQVEFTPTAGTTYYIEVAAYADDPTTSQLTLNLAAAGPVPVTATFKSVGANDGWVLESAETSGVGGTLDSAATTCRVGDDAGDRQYRAILDFNTGSLPNDAVITGVALRIKSSSLVGTSPFGTHGKLTADVRRGAFNGNLALESADFEAAASKSSAGTFGTTPVSGWYRSDLLASAYSKVNLNGRTQFRLRFATDDNDDAGADYLAFLCGNAAAASRPQLIVTYYLP